MLGLEAEPDRSIAARLRAPTCAGLSAQCRWTGGSRLQRVGDVEALAFGRFAEVSVCAREYCRADE